jgi:type II secretory ATPase GspE/PulE/Tfp pilus assembly ATPase PilB-like protein
MLMKDADASLVIDVSTLAPEAAVARLVEHAVSMPASDLFFTHNEQNLSVQVRHLGIVRPLAVVPTETGKRYLQHIKAMAGMDVAEKRRPMDGRWIYRKAAGSPVDLRINIVPTMYGEDFAIRLLARDGQLYTLENLGLCRDQYNQVLQMIEAPAGLILMTGPTGSGKTATQYAALVRLNDGRRKINTIEDPIEYAVEGLRQSQVNAAIDVGFPELLRSVLRQSPDVIMIGEIRDGETAQTAVHAANSGMLVFATLHAPAAAGAIQSMRSLGVHSHFLSTSLRGIVSQRLVRTLCPNCKMEFDLTDFPGTFDEVKPWLVKGEGKTLYAAAGCRACGTTGYAGRTGVFEVMPVSRAIRNLISDGAPAREIRNRAVEEKMLEFRQAALLKVARGETSTEEVFRVIPTEHLMLED